MNCSWGRTCSSLATPTMSTTPAHAARTSFVDCQRAVSSSKSGMTSTVAMYIKPPAERRGQSHKVFPLAVKHTSGERQRPFNEATESFSKQADEAAQQCTNPCRELKVHGLAPRESALHKYGEVSYLMWNLMNQHSDCGCQSNRSARLIVVV